MLLRGRGLTLPKRSSMRRPGESAVLNLANPMVAARTMACAFSLSLPAFVAVFPLAATSATFPFFCFFPPF